MPALQRTEDQQIAMLPVTVTFGSTEYPIKPLSINKGMEWRERFASETDAIVSMLKGEAETTEAFVGGLKYAFLQFPQRIADMVFAFAPNLPAETIKDEATDEQLAYAFGVVIQLAFPFSRQLHLMNQVVKVAANLSASASASK